MTTDVATLTAYPHHADEVTITGPELLCTWREEQRVRVPGAEHTRLFKRRQWDGTKAPGRWCRQRDGWFEMRCSRGILGRLRQQYEVVEPGGHVPDPLLVAAWIAAEPRFADLRDYQQEAITRGLSEMWGRIALATNAGKGAVIGLLAAFAAAHDTSALILCDEVAVFDALHDELANWTALRVGTLERGASTPPELGGVTLAMVPTLARRLKDEEEDGGPWTDWVSSHGMLLLDEADKATAGGWRRILTAARGSWWRLGFSGSFPDPAKQPHAHLLLDELIGPILVQARNAELIARGISARPFVELHRFDVTAAVGRAPVKWWEMRPPQLRQLVYERTIVFNAARHAYIASLIQPNVPTALIVNRVDHGESLALHIPGAVFLDGKASRADRRRVLADFEQGRTRVLVVTKILDRGTNRLGSAADLLFVSGEGSTRQTIQRIGRGLRRAGGKEFLRLIDIIDRVVLTDTANKFDRRAATYLATAMRQRIELYNAEAFEVALVKAEQ